METLRRKLIRLYLADVKRTMPRAKLSWVLRDCISYVRSREAMPYEA